MVSATAVAFHLFNPTDWPPLAVDGIGIMGALGITALFDTQLLSATRKPARLLLPPVAGIALVIACVPSLWYSYALVQQKRAFPVLLTFEYLWERSVFGQAN